MKNLIEIYAIVLFSKVMFSLCQIKINTTEVGGFLYSYFSFGYPSQNFYERINQKLNFTYVSPSVFKKNVSKTLQLKNTQKLYVGQALADAEMVIDSINTTVFNISTFNFYFIQNASRLFLTGNELGMGYNIINENFSLIYLLKNLNIISRLEYAIVPGNNQFSGSLYLGGMPVNESIKYNFRTTCKVNKTYEAWGCTLNSVFYGDISFISKSVEFTNQYMNYFQASEPYILAPDEFMRFLEKNVFEKYYGLGKCGYMEGINDYFECSKDIINELSNSFVFAFGDSVITIKRDDLFKCFEHKCKFLIMNNRIGDQWVLGMQFMRFFAMNFDYENSEISFYSNNKNIHIIDVKEAFIFKGFAEKFLIFVIIGLAFSLIKIYKSYEINKKIVERKESIGIDENDKEKGIELL